MLYLILRSKIYLNFLFDILQARIALEQQINKLRDENDALRREKKELEQKYKEQIIAIEA